MDIPADAHMTAQNQPTQHIRYHCHGRPGRKPPSLAVKRPARLCKKRAIENRLLWETRRARERPGRARTEPDGERNVEHAVALLREIRRAAHWRRSRGARAPKLRRGFEYRGLPASVAKVCVTGVFSEKGPAWFLYFIYIVLNLVLQHTTQCVHIITICRYGRTIVPGSRGTLVHTKCTYFILNVSIY